MGEISHAEFRLLPCVRTVVVEDVVEFALVLPW